MFGSTFSLWFCGAVVSVDGSVGPASSVFVASSVRSCSVGLSGPSSPVTGPMTWRSSSSKSRSEYSVHGTYSVSVSESVAVSQSETCCDNNDDSETARKACGKTLDGSLIVVCLWVCLVSVFCVFWLVWLECCVYVMWDGL